MIRNYQKQFPLVVLLLLLSAASVTPAALGQAHDWQTGDRVSASFEGSNYSFYPATIVGARPGYFKVRYDGHDSNWDDWVPLAKIRALASDTPAQTAALRPAANPAVQTNPQAQGGTCAVGSRLSRAGMTNRPAAIIAIDQAKGLYKVKYDNGDLDEWMPARLFDGCKGSEGTPITGDYFIGEWSLFVGPTPHYEDNYKNSGDSYLVVGPGGKAPPLVVKADGSYVWTIDSRTVIQGRWRKMADNEIKYGTKAPAILMINGENGQDWQMWQRPSVGVADTRDRMVIEGMRIGTSAQGTRIR